MLLPAIVIPAYNRAHCLRRLLNGVAKAHFPQGKNITLVISIDHHPQANQAVVEEASGFVWQFGQKIIINHPAHLGLKQHILFCGALTQTYGAAIILEDDLLVSPFFYDYACQALQFYQQQPRIAGISLYNYTIAENGYFPFIPLDDGADVYFMQVASSWGQAFTAQQWHNFDQWLQANPPPHKPTYPDYLQQWSDESWKKRFIGYLIETDKYFVFPRLSLTTNTTEPGTHAITKGLFQVPLQMAEKKYQLGHIHQSNAVYDAFFEMLPYCLNRLCPHLAAYVYTTDLYATKTPTQIATPYVLTTRMVDTAVAAYGQELLPNVLNIAYNQPGNTIKLAPTQALLPMTTPPYKQHYQLLSVAHATFEPLFNQPPIGIVLPVFEHREADLLQTVQSLVNQYYPNLQLVLVATSPVFTQTWFNEQIQPHLLNVQEAILAPCFAPNQPLALLLWQGLMRLTTPIVALSAHAGVLYQPYSLNMAAQIFSGFKQVNWLLATHSPHHHITDVSTSLPQYRFTKERFYATPATVLHRFFMPEYQFFRRFMLQNAQHVFTAPLSNQLFHLLLAEYFFNTQEPVSVFRPAALLPMHEANLSLPQSAALPKLPLTYKASGKSLLKNVLRAVVKPFYLSDIAYLRYLYAELAQLPPVARYHPPTNSYYLSRF